MVRSHKSLGALELTHDAANDAVLLGPDSVGQFMPTAVKTIQRKRASVNSGEAGQSVSSV